MLKKNPRSNYCHYHAELKKKSILDAPDHLATRVEHLSGRRQHRYLGITARWTDSSGHASKVRIVDIAFQLLGSRSQRLRRHCARFTGLCAKTAMFLTSLLKFKALFKAFLINGMKT